MSRLTGGLLELIKSPEIILKVSVILRVDGIHLTFGGAGREQWCQKELSKSSVVTTNVYLKRVSKICRPSAQINRQTCKAHNVACCDSCMETYRQTEKIHYQQKHTQQIHRQTGRKRRFCIDLGPLRGSSSPLQCFELARAKPA